MFSVHRFKFLPLTILFSCFISAGSLSAQVGLESGLWHWSDDAMHHRAIVQVESGGGIGTGIIVRVDREKPVADGFQGWCLTAWHVVSDDNDQRQIRIRFTDGRAAKGCKVLAKDEENDTALLWVWVPNDVTAVSIAAVPVQPGQPIEIAGLGGGSTLGNSLRHFHTVAAVTTTSSKVFADVTLLPGDSGGPVFNELGEVVGVVSGGWFWFDGGVVGLSGRPVRTTWPARTSNLKSIADLVAAAENGVDPEVQVASR